MSKKPHIVIMGAGAIGAYFGGLIAKHNTAKVSFIARGEHLKKLQKNKGITIKTKDEEELIEIPSFSADDALKHMPDWIIMCVKSMDTPGAIASIKKWVGSDTKILTIQNGIENYELLRDEFGKERVLRGMCHIGVELTAPGEITYRSLGILTIGEEDGKTKAESHALYQILKDAGIDARYSDNIKKECWKKFLWNCVYNMLTGLTATTTDVIYKHTLVEDFARKLAGEVAQAAKAVDQVSITQDDIDQVFADTKKIGAFKTSTFQDRLKKKNMEYDVFCGYLVRKAKKHDLSLPGYQYMYAMYKMLEDRKL